MDKVIREEYQLGCDGLPAPVRSHFQHDIEKVLGSSLIQQKSWLVMVRASRSRCNSHDTLKWDDY